MEYTQEMPEVSVICFTDTVGASRRLTERFGRSFGIDSVHAYVKTGKLRAFRFESGELVRHQPTGTRGGKDLIFLRSDLEEIEPPKRAGRPAANGKGEDEAFALTEQVTKDAPPRLQGRQKPDQRVNKEERSV